MMEPALCLRNATELALRGGLHARQAEASFAPFLCAEVRLLRKTKGQPLTHAGQTIHNVYLLVGGSCSVFKYSPEGKSLLAGVYRQPQIFGLYESLCEGNGYTATVEALEDCLLLEVSADFFMDCLQKDAQMMWTVLQHLAIFVDTALMGMDRFTLNTQEQNILLYCYGQCAGKRFPATLEGDKTLMAEELNINLRTLYRKLTLLRQEGLVGSAHGKITISRRQYELIGARVRDWL